MKPNGFRIVIPPPVGGAHRLWTHKSYKATLPLKLFFLGAFASLMLCFVLPTTMSMLLWGENWRNDDFVTNIPNEAYLESLVLLR
ncbi:uncharacterized protein LOC126964737 [Leptidea sinapis]|uniref:uncharacterized protein LOC126964737 n=1 Tax=Leptidea sinapis TaxID=189913 RepID=UPI0021C45A84|nr:uncharacterized protein LOC126964737 [Leptidea sinapis]